MDKAFIMKLVQRIEARTFYLLRTVSSKDVSNKEVVRKEIILIYNDSCTLLAHLNFNGIMEEDKKKS